VLYVFFVGNCFCNTAVFSTPLFDYLGYHENPQNYVVSRFVGEFARKRKKNSSTSLCVLLLYPTCLFEMMSKFYKRDTWWHSRRFQGDHWIPASSGTPSLLHLSALQPVVVDRNWVWAAAASVSFVRHVGDSGAAIVVA